MKLKSVRICIITTRNIFDAPCLAKYQMLIHEPFDIIYWDRCNITEKCGAENYYKYSVSLRMEAGKLEKLCKYIGFVRYVQQVLKEHTYEKIIFFPTQMGWLIQGKLCHRYKGKYIFDIRDYAGERNKIFAYMTGKLVDNADVCNITSPAYQTFSPQKHFVIAQNIQSIEQELIENYRTKKRSSKNKIILSFMGQCVL